MSNNIPCVIVTGVDYWANRRRYVFVTPPLIRASNFIRCSTTAHTSNGINVGLARWPSPYGLTESRPTLTDGEMYQFFVAFHACLVFTITLTCLLCVDCLALSMPLRTYSV